MLNRRQLFGNAGEQVAGRYLQKQGLTIVHKNYRCKYGEIDIIAKDQSYLVFIEVKTRSSIKYGDPIASVTNKKQKQICKAAQNYLFEHNLTETDVRFDVIGILQQGKGQEINHIKDAFEFSY